MVTKQEIRKEILIRRNQLSSLEIAAKSSRILDKLKNHPLFSEAETILSFVSFGSEVRTEEIIELAWKEGKKVCVPKVHGKKMDFYYFQSWNELSKSSYGIPEPKEELCSLFCLDKAEKVLVLMPGVAFDSRFHRIGYGGGYYDKYFAKYPDLHMIALAFEVQMVSDIPTEEFDIRPHDIITEAEIKSRSY